MIASLSIGATRIFRLKRANGAPEESHPASGKAAEHEQSTPEPDLAEVSLIVKLQGPGICACTHPVSLGRGHMYPSSVAHISRLAGLTLTAYDNISLCGTARCWCDVGAAIVEIIGDLLSKGLCALKWSIPLPAGARRKGSCKPKERWADWAAWAG